MNKLLISLLKTVVQNLENGDSDLEDEQCKEAIELIQTYSIADSKLSKYQACAYLKLSRASFDNYVRCGNICRGSAQPGFKELFWRKRDLDKFRILRNG